MWDSLLRTGSLGRAQKEAHPDAQQIQTRVRELEEELRLLREQGKWMGLLLASLPNKVFVKDTESRFVYVNEALAGELGITPREMIEKTDYDFFPNHLADAYRADDQRVMQTRQPLVQVEKFMAGGKERFVEVSKSPIVDEHDRVVGQMGYFTDVTARVDAEDALRESEARKGAIVQSALDCIITVDQEGRVTEFNPSAERTFGYQREHVLGKQFTEVLFPSFSQATSQRLENAVQRAGGSMIGNRSESVARRADGTEFPVEMAMTLIPVKGELVFTIYLRDITRRKQDEEELQRRNAELVKAYANLKEAEAQLIHSEKMAAIGQIVAGLAHEINNPAAYVLTNLAVIGRNFEDVRRYVALCHQLEEAAESYLPEQVEEIQALRTQFSLEAVFDEVGEMLDAAKGGMKRITGLVATLKSHSRLDRSEVAMGDLNEGLRTTLVLLEPMIGKRKRINLQLGELPLVECNVGQINQVFMNLLVNALQAVPEDGIVAIRSEASGGGVLVRVKDNGPGIPASIQSRIFDPFFTTKDVGKGTGLGLSISRRIIEGHGGQLSFESVEGQGAEFRVWLPLHRVVPPSGPKLAAPAAPADDEGSIFESGP